MTTLQRPAAVFAIEGERVACAFCSHELYELRRDLVWMTPIRAADFKPLSRDVPQLVDGEIPRCPFCGVRWFADWYERLNRGEFSAFKLLPRDRARVREDVAG